MHRRLKRRRPPRSIPMRPKMAVSRLARYPRRWISAFPDEPAGDPPMPEKKTRARALKDKAEGKSASTQAGEYVREEIDHVREGKHGARSAKQAIAIGLSKARRDGVKATPAGSASAATKKKAAVDAKAHPGSPAGTKKSATRSRASTAALDKEGKKSVSKTALAKQARKSAAKRPASARSAASRKAAETKGAAGRKAAAKKGARTRAAS